MSTSTVDCLGRFVSEMCRVGHYSLLTN